MRAMNPTEQADLIEQQMIQDLEEFVTVKSVIYSSGERDPRRPVPRPPDSGKRYLMGHDPRLPRMPDKPTIFDYFTYRFGPTQHLLQSARLARKNGADEKIVLACLLHDTVQEIMRSDHGYWGAQLYEPYVPERTSFAIRYHQALRFYADTEAGYEYPDLYRRVFGIDYVPSQHVQDAYKFARAHRWYDAPREVTVSDLYAFDPDAVVGMDPFVDLIGRHVKQPKEGLGNDNSPVAHMWRTIANPDAPL